MGKNWAGVVAGHREFWEGGPTATLTTKAVQSWGGPGARLGARLAEGRKLLEGCKPRSLRACSC